MNYVLAGPSLAHTYGNVTAFYTEFIKGLFPDGYFKSVHISSKIAFREFNILQNKNKEFFKKSKPMLIIRPRVEINDSNEFLKGSYLTTRIADHMCEQDVGNLQNLISDDDKGIHMKFLLNRMSMYFDVSIIVETQMEQLNLGTYLKNRIMIERPFDIPTNLENCIPKEFISVLATEAGYSLDTMEGTQKFLSYLNTHSYYPITYKMKNSTGNDEFFRYYPVTLDTTMSEISMDEGSKKGVVHNTFTLNFTVSSQFYIAGLFYYFTQNPKLFSQIDWSIKTDNSIIPMFTVSNLFDLQLPGGWKLYTSPMYRVDSDCHYDHMDFKCLLNSSLTDMFNYHKTNHIPYETFIKISILKDNRMLVEKDEFDIDYETFTVITKAVNLASTYRLLIHVNTLYINTLISTLYEFTEEK